MILEENTYEFSENIYFVSDEFDVGSSIWPIRFGRNTAKPGYHAGPRTINYYSLHFVRGGTAELTYGNEKATLKEGDMFCLFPDCSYSYRMIDDAAPLEMTWIAFDGVQAPSLLAMIPISPAAPFARKKLTKEIQLTLQQLLQAGKKQSSNVKLKRYSLLYRLFSQLVDPPDTAESSVSGPRDWILDSMEYMKTHYGEPIGVRHAADHVGIHRTHFSKLFTEHVGMNPSEYLRKQRMEQALHLLCSTSRPIVEIGLSIGFADSASFTRAFGQYYSVSPKQARLAGREKNRLQTTANLV